MDTIRSTLKLCAAALIAGMALILSTSAQAQPDIRIVGNASYSHTRDTAILSVDKIQNVSVAMGLSNGMRLELWALRSPFTGLGQVGYAQSGHLTAQYVLGPLTPNRYFLDVYTGPIPFTPPPSGDWYFTILLTDQNGGVYNGDGYLATDFRNFPAESFAQPKIPTTISVPGFTPKAGLWWNPSESGTGYGIDYSGGTLVVTVFSYKPNGDSQWYLAVGPLNGATTTATLDKYSDGQCIGCGYAGKPSLIGNDGSMTISFTSSTAATVTLPGGRVTQIQPMF